MLAVFATYIVERVMRHLRQSIGEANLTKKSLVHENFMM